MNVVRVWGLKATFLKAGTEELRVMHRLGGGT